LKGLRGRGPQFIGKLQNKLVVIERDKMKKGFGFNRASLSALPIALLLTCVCGFAFTAHSAAISISGTVKDSDGKAVPGATVSAVADASVKTVSGADGSFTLSGSLPDTRNGKVPVAASKDGLMTAQVLAPTASAKGLAFKLFPTLVGTSVTIMGNRMNEVHLRDEAQWSGEAGKVHFVFVITFDGPPAIKAEIDQIWNDYHPTSSLDGDQALELENQFRKRLMFYLDGPLVDDKVKKGENYGPGHMISVTGTVSEKDGKKYINPTAFGTYNGPTYPAQVTGPIQPIVKLPVKPPLTIKLTDTLTDALIYVPAGKFFMGSPLEQAIHWQEAPSRMITLSKGFYMSDHPILNSEYAAVTGDNTANPKGNPPDAAVNISCAMFDKYIKALAKLNPGKVIRASTKAEWEYTARCGNSDLCPFSAKEGVGSRYGEICTRLVPVKSKKPNAWGFYGMFFSDGSERSSDIGFYMDHKLMLPLTDPKYPVAKCAGDFPEHIHACSGVAMYPVQELMSDNSNAGAEVGGSQRNNFKHIRERIVVEE